MPTTVEDSARVEVSDSVASPRSRVSLPSIVERLERETFQWTKHYGADDLKVRLGWNFAVAHILGWLRLEVGLAELAACDVDAIDLGGES